MKSFACGDVVPSCTATWLCSTDDELMAAVALHAHQVHGIADLPDAVVAQVRSRILVVA
jgi:predicted small metal-binding protein